MRFQPRLKNGDIAPLTWPIALYRRCNPLVWPLEMRPTVRDVYMEWSLKVFGFLAYFLQLEADVHYLFLNFQDMDKLLNGLPIFLVQLETLIRHFHLALNKNELKTLLKRFYEDIYMTEKSNPSNFANIKRQMLGPRFIAIFYIATMVTFFYDPVKNFMADRREMLYKQEYFVDHSKLPFYIPLILLNLMVGIYVDTILFGELNLLGEFMMHLNGRYLELRSDLRLSVSQLLERNDVTHIARDYYRDLIQILRRNVSLKSFAEDVQNHFSLRIFVTFSVSALILCTLGFLCYTDPANNIVCIVWLFAKLLELMIFGYLGSELYQTTNEMDLMYYCCDWEQIIYRSKNTKANIQLMKLIVVSIELNSRPFALTGLRYFSVTLSSVLKIIQGAFSYFTFLKSMH